MSLKATSTKSQKRHLAFVISAILIAAFTQTFPARAQKAAGELRGHVTDELGGLIIGAQVLLTDAVGRHRTSTTNQEGSYLFAGLAPGHYALRVEANGFAPFESAEVEVKDGGGESLDIKLSVALEKQEVTVGAEAGLNVAPANNAGALVLGAAELEALPDDPDDLTSALQAIAGPSAGPDGGQIIVDN